MFLKLGTEVGNSMSRLSLSCHVIYSTPCIRSFTQLAETIVFGWLGRAYCDRLLCSCRLPLLYLARSCVSSRAPPSMSHCIFNAVSPDHSIDPTPVIKFPSANNAKHIGSPYPPVQIATAVHTVYAALAVDAANAAHTTIAVNAVNALDAALAILTVHAVDTATRGRTVGTAYVSLTFTASRLRSRGGRRSRRSHLRLSKRSRLRTRRSHLRTPILRHRLASLWLWRAEAARLKPLKCLRIGRCARV
jgi:hypothetical protein